MVLRDFEFAGFEAEGAGHSAAAGLDGFDRGTGLAQESDFAGRAAEDGLVMTVAVNQDVRALKPAGSKVRRTSASQSARSQTCSLRRLARRIVGEEFRAAHL